MDKSVRPTCVVCLEVPLTVTFTVVNEADSLLWTGGCYSESEHSEEYKSSSGSLVGEHSLEHNSNMHESMSVADGGDAVHDVDATTDFHPFEIADKREMKYSKGSDHTQIKNRIFNNETILRADTPSMNGHDPRCEIDGHILVTDEHHRGDILVNGLPCNGQNISLDKLNLLSGIFPAATRSLPKSRPSISKKPCGETNTVSTDSFTFPRRGIPPSAENSATQRELGISKTEAELGQSGGIAESSLNGLSRSIDEEIRDLTLNNVTEKACLITTSHRTRDGVKKDERNHLDPGYFTEEGNEGSKDDLHTNDCVVHDDDESSSKTGCDVTAASSPDNGFHDESRGAAATRKDGGGGGGVRPKFGILKHSKTSASFDLHTTEHLPISLIENWTDCYHMLSSNAMPPSKTVAFCEQQLPKQKWDFTGDTSGAMDRLRAITSHLCLPVISGHQSDQKANQLWRYKQHVSADKDAPLADDTQQNLTLTFPDLNEFITGIEQELFQIKKSDETIASQLLALYTEIRQYKYTCNCQLYREMMETAIDNEDKKDELSRHHVDTIPERLCATLKQWGLTRINLQRRRFSIF